MRTWLAVLTMCLTMVFGLGTAGLAEEVTLTFLWPAYTPSKIRYGEELVRQFEAANPDIKIDLQVVPDPYEKLTVMVAGGTPPDVVWLGAAWHQFMGLFLPLDEFVARDAADLDVDDFLAPVWAAHVWDGVRYALPTGYQTLAGYYNKDRYNEVGRAFPHDDWTVEEMIQDGRAMTRDINGDGQPDRWGVSWLYGHVWSFLHYGGQVADAEWKRVRINNPVTARSLTLWDGLQHEYGIAPPGHGSLSMIENGDIGVFASGIWLQETLDQSRHFDYDLVDYPWLEVDGGRHRGTIIYPEELAILKTTNHPDAAWRFLKFATGSEHLQWAAGEGHIVPVRHSVLQSPAFARPDKRMQVWYTSAEYAHELMPHPAYNDLVAAFNEYWPKISGPNPEMSVEAGLELIAQRMQIVLDEYNNRK